MSVNGRTRATQGTSGVVDPQYAPAYAGLADAYISMGYLDFVPPREADAKAKAAALKALQIDETSAEAHASLGAVLEFYDRDGVAAERAFKRAVELNANYATAHHWYAQLLAPLGRVDECLAEGRRALEKAAEDRSNRLVFIAVDPAFDSLRGDPKFRDLLGRMNLTDQ